MLPPTSCCLIVQNEEATLPTCLASVAGLVHEVIVLDTGSTDGTKEVAARRGARIFVFPWCDDFAAARNESIRHATCPWILWLDADECRDEENRQKLRELLANLPDDNTAYTMKQRSAMPGPGGSVKLVTQVRLFRRHPDIRWQYRVHEQILPALNRLGHRVVFTDLVIPHTGYEDPTLKRHKLQRNLRLLEMEFAEQPEDPFTLFNLGAAYLELGRPAEALPHLRNSLGRSQPAASIARVLYGLLAECHLRLGQVGEALAGCRAGRARCPDDGELLALEGRLLRGRGDQEGAEACWRQLLHSRAAEGFTIESAGLRGYRSRHELALLCREQGRHAEAEAHWREAVAEQADFAPAWQGLGELCLTQGRWAELDMAIGRLEGSAEAEVLRARGSLARKEFAAARVTLEQVIARWPQVVLPRVLLTHVLLQEDRDPAAAERALRAVLELDPKQAESWRNLALLLRQRGRLAEAVAGCRSGLAYCPGDVDLLLLQGAVLKEFGDVMGAETAWLRVLEQAADGGDSKGRQQRGTARQQLAALYLESGRLSEAAGQGRAAVIEWPELKAAWLGLAALLQKAGPPS